MSTELTFRPLHLQQWLNFHSWEHYSDYLRVVFLNSIYNTSTKSLWTLFSGTVMMEATYLFVIVFRFNKHNMYRIPTQTKCFQIVSFSFFPL